MDLMTIGYEGLNLDQFFGLLRAASVEVILDVRQNPISRKKGFSKNALATAACERGFRYVHLPAFGCPKSVREQYRSDADWTAYTASYKAHLDTLEIPLALLARQILTNRCCLLCFEADPATCHRSFVAERVASAVSEPLGIVHLLATDPVLAV